MASPLQKPSKSKASSSSPLFLSSASGAQLQQNLDRLAQLQLQAQALGINDTTGTGIRGLLSGAIDIFGRPLNASAGLFTGAWGLTDPNEEQDPFKRALLGLQGEQYRLGNYLQAGPDAGILERALYGTGTFLGDVALDPLTYVGGKGFEALGRAGAAATEAEVVRAATKVLKPIARTPQVEAPIATALGTSTDVAKQAAKDKMNLINPQATLRPGADVKLASLIDPQIGTEAAIAKTQLIKSPSFTSEILPPPSVAPIASTVNKEVDPFIQKLAENAAGAKVATGPLGARRSIENDLRAQGYTEDQVQNITKEILKNTSEVTTGGTGLKLPGIGRDAEGKIALGGNRTSKMLIKTPGAGYGLDSKVLNDITQSTRIWYNRKVRSNDAYAYMSGILSGSFGEEYANVIKHYGTNGIKGYDYSTMKGLVASREAQLQLAKHLDEMSIATLESARNLVEKNAKNKEQALNDFNYFYGKGAGTELPVNATYDQKLAHEAAMNLQSYNNGLRADAVLAGSRTGTDVNLLIDRKAGRIFTKEEVEWQKKRGERISDYNPNAKRRILSEVDPNTGATDSLTNADVNKLYQSTLDSNGNPLRPAGHKVFDENALTIAASEIASNTKLLTHLNYIADLLDTGNFTEGEQRIITLLDTANVANRLNGRVAKIGDRLKTLRENATTGDSIRAIDILIEKLSTNKDTINATLSSINPLDEQSVKKVGTMMDLMQSILDEYKVTTGTNMFTDKQIKKLMSEKGFTITRDTLDNISDTVAIDLSPLGMQGKVNVPKQLSNAFANEAVAKSVEKYFKVQSSKMSELEKITNNFYSPYYTLFKTWATIGRGLGYHVKNLTGAAWNNDLGGVTIGDNKQSAAVLLKAKNARNTAKNAIENLQNGKSSGLTGDAHILAKYIADVSNVQGIPASDLYKQQLADYILFNELKDIKVGSHSMADVYAAATDNGMFRDNRRMEALRNDARLSGGELADHLTDSKYVNLFKGYSKSELNGIQNAVNFIANPQYKAFKPLQWSADIAGASENFVRLAAFIQGARRYGVNDGGTAASLFAKALQFDYSDLSDFERVFLKNIIPFYTWTRRNVPLQFHSLLTQPGKYTRLGSAADELENAFSVNEDEQPLANIVPSFMRDRMGFVSSVSSNDLLPSFLKDKIGSDAPLVMGIETPASDLNRFIPFGAIGGLGSDVTKQTVSSLNPLLKTGIETASGTSTFTGAKFSPTGTASPLGNNFTGITDALGITNKDAEGNPVVSSQGLNALTNLVPVAGNLFKSIPLSENNQKRYLTNMGAMWLGSPFSTLDTKQAGGETMNRITTLQNEITKKVNNGEIDKDWLKQMIKYNTPVEVIQASIEAGLGRRPIQ